MHTHIFVGGWASHENTQTNEQTKRNKTNEWNTQTNKHSYDPAARPTAEEALAHDYFEPIRRLLAQEEEEERRRRLYPFLPPTPPRGGK